MSKSNLPKGESAIRKKLALEAAWGVDAVVRLLDETAAEAIMHGDDDERYNDTIRCRCLARRVKEYASVLMTVLGDDDGRPTSELYEVIYDERMPAKEVVHG